MEVEANDTFIILDGHVELSKYKYLYFITVFIMYVLIVCSNSTIVYLIYKHQDLHEPMYVFIAALLLNSVLLSTNIYPKLLMDFLSEKQTISYQACVLQYYVLYTFGSSEFLLLAAMAYDRYVSICKPLQYPTIMTTNSVRVCLGVAWLLPALQFAALATLSSSQKLCSFTLKVMFCNNTIYKLFCVASKSISLLGVLALLSVNIVPLLFIVFSYSRVLVVCFHSGGDVRRKAAQTCLPHLMVLINYVFLGTYDVVTVRLESDIPTIAHFIIALQLVLYNPLINPVIYGLKMKDIYKHLKRFFRQKLTS